MLSANIHDVWALQRIAEGWSWGPQRDDGHKQHPDLKPYCELDDTEKEYDRKTVTETLKTIQLLGFKILPPDQADEAPDLEKLKSKVQRLRKEGKSLQAFDAASKGLIYWPGDLRLHQLQAMALADSGAAQAANTVLQRLVNQGNDDEETLSLLGRTYKQLWYESSDPKQRRRCLAATFASYSKCYALSQGYYPGINAATAAALLGEMDTARRLAAAVRADCLQRFHALPADEGAYYLVATLGEACLILDARAEAVDWYQKTAELGRGNYRDIFSTRLNARFLLEKLELDTTEVETALRLPSVAVFTGHMIDRPGRPTPRFPGDSPALEEAVRQAIDRNLVMTNVGFGYSSAAAGGDIIFQEALAARGLEGHVALPYNSELFIRDSVDLAPGTQWVERCRILLQRLEALGNLELTSDWPIEGGVNSYGYANQVIFGLASLHRQRLQTDLTLIALWDRKRGDGSGGTEDTINWWESLGHRVAIIDLEQLKSSIRLDSAPRGSAARTTALPCPSLAEGNRARFPSSLIQAPGVPTPEVRIMALLFADVVNYSKLPEPSIPTFVHYFMGGVAKLAETTGYVPAFKNEWGDAIYFAFEDLRQAGLLSLHLADFVQSYDWTAVGLPASLNMRIALHAGPVYVCDHPVVRRSTCTGTHVNRAARIEPVTPHGYVYASQSFAALAASSTPEINEFGFDYVGQLKLAKNFGTFPMYRVRPGKK